MDDDRICKLVQQYLYERGYEQTLYSLKQVRGFCAAISSMRELEEQKLELFLVAGHEYIRKVLHDCLNAEDVSRDAETASAQFSSCVSTTELAIAVGE